MQFDPACSWDFSQALVNDDAQRVWMPQTTITTFHDHELLASEITPVEMENHQIIQTLKPPPFTFARTLMDDDEIFFATFPDARPSGWVPSFVPDQSFSGDENLYSSLHNACSSEPQLSVGYAVPSSEVMPILSNSSPILGWTGTETTAQIVAASEPIPRIMDSLQPPLSSLGLHDPHPSAAMFDDSEPVQSPMVVPSQQYSMDLDIQESMGSPGSSSAATSVSPEPPASYPRLRVRIPISGTIGSSLLSGSSGKMSKSSGSSSTSSATYSRRNSRILKQETSDGMSLESPSICASESPQTASSAKQTSTKKPPLACLFCRGRKIACGQPIAGSEDRTCK
ncbi:hypothetical protein C8J56DRAFT_1051378 [Mycena floridula]|nr:hypothetical protein C8J56DRAFT_1051378 [Mycena floridula]